MLWFCLKVPYLLIICKSKHHASVSTLFQSPFCASYLLLDKEEQQREKQNLRNTSFYAKMCAPQKLKELYLKEYY